MSPVRRSRSPARAWFELEWRLLLLGAEERRFPGLLACRDPARPRVWDRQVAIAGSLPRRPAVEVAALDRYYREAASEQWSLVAHPAAAGAAWAEALEPQGAVAETMLLLSRRPRGFPPGRELLRLEGRDGFRRLVPLLEAVTEAAAGGVAAQVLEAVALRRLHGFPAHALAIEEEGEIVASITLTPAGKRVWMEDLMVLPDRRRKGLGRELFRAGESAARARGAVAVGFSATAADWPSAWYRRDGFAVAGEVLRLRRTW